MEWKRYMTLKPTQLPMAAEVKESREVKEQPASILVLKKTSYSKDQLGSSCL